MYKITRTICDGWEKGKVFSDGDLRALMYKASGYGMREGSVDTYFPAGFMLANSLIALWLNLGWIKKVAPKKK